VAGPDPAVAVPDLAAAQVARQDPWRWDAAAEAAPDGLSGFFRKLLFDLLRRASNCLEK